MAAAKKSKKSKQAPAKKAPAKQAPAKKKALAKKATTKRAPAPKKKVAKAPATKSPAKKLATKNARRSEAQPSKNKVVPSPKPATTTKRSPAEGSNGHAAPVPTLRAVAGRFDLSAARAVWFARQGLGSTAEPMPLSRLVAKTGWLRTLGGADVYIAARARRPGMHRAELDAAAASHALRVIPAVRSCIYLVPEEHASVALRFAEGIWRKRTDREVERAGTSWREVEELGKAIAGAIANAPMSTDAIRRSLPAGTIRSLGDAGKKLGLSSPLPIALRDLEFRGTIERTLEGGRLDTERYVWRTAQPTSPQAGRPNPTDADVLDSITRIFFSQMGPATVADFATWAGISQREAMATMHRAELLPVTIGGLAATAFIDEAGLVALDQPATFGDHVTFLSFEDNYIVPHGGPALFSDPQHHWLPVSSWGSSSPTTLAQAKHLSTRTILVGDRLAGFWEFDPDAQEVVVKMFDVHEPSLLDHVEAEATAFARFLFEDIGHARSFSLDTDDSVRERAAALRQMPSLVVH